MKIYFLGTNGWYDTKTGNTTCILIETKKEFIILDAGSGFYKLDRYIKNKKPIYLFLSHFHLDHIIGLHILAKFNFTQGIDIYGPIGTKKILNIFINTPYTMPMENLRTPVKLNELSTNNSISFKVEYKNLLHSTICLGYKLFLEDKIITYLPDTGVCKNIYILAKHADLLITECSYKYGQIDKNWPHLNPENAARVACDSGAKKLALIHFDASLYLALRDRKDAEKHARKIFKDTYAAYDNLELGL